MSVYNQAGESIPLARPSAARLMVRAAMLRQAAREADQKRRADLEKRRAEIEKRRAELAARGQDATDLDAVDGPEFKSRYTTVEVVNGVEVGVFAPPTFVSLSALDDVGDRGQHDQKCGGGFRRLRKRIGRD